MKHLLVRFLLCIWMPLLAATTAPVGSEKAAMCAGCHGTQGISPNPDWPNLAGQHAPYLEKQLHDYKDATLRHDAIMTALVAALTDDEIHALAVFYAGLPLPEGLTPQANQAKGEAIYRRGDLSKHITACIACHGPKGTGNAEAGFPVLSGQQSGYTIQQLQAFKDNNRQNDLRAIMREISARMGPEDMEAVAHYLAGTK